MKTPDTQEQPNKEVVVVPRQQSPNVSFAELQQELDAFEVDLGPDQQKVTPNDVVTALNSEDRSIQKQPIVTTFAESLSDEIEERDCDDLDQTVIFQPNSKP